MRIIAGSLGGRLIDSPGTNRTHPMSEKARGAIFNALGDLSGLTVLDAYAGSGALAIEAVSRGAEHALAIDADAEAVKAISANIQALGLQNQIDLLLKNISGWSRNNQSRQFDVVLADPPYINIRPNVIERLALHAKPQGLFVLSWPGSEPVRKLPSLTIISHKTYGDIQLVFYRRM